MKEFSGVSLFHLIPLLAILQKFPVSALTFLSYAIIVYRKSRE
ncbi:hypothetical protein HMPREF9395_0447 [Streptococcus sanguinis SK1058]|nr:hypothetical protein HMPREF9392_0042 [Streptococcus sanguinis SK678]EGF22259.1 hypothetical protein HMPREF9395_0447 [Streptococcus sanguinis SK1058]